jgi:Tfp pilus assembly protein PilV
MNFQRRLSGQQGQGLIESLITVLIIFGTVVALMSFQATLAYNDSLTTEQADATMLAVNRLETLRDYQVLTVQPPYAAYASIASGNTTSVGLNATYTITWTVTAFTNPTYKNIGVTVTWTDRRGKAQSIALVTKVAGIDPTTSSSIM